jgi:glycerophosphoryl diester phosphodiesterase
VFDLQGHRGARGLFPENTLAGFAGALALGVSSLELDVAVTADDVAVVTHDVALHPDLTRDAHGAWLLGERPLIHSLSLDELRRFDVGRARPGSPVAAAFPEQRSCDGQSVPTLVEVLALAVRHGIPADVELKTDPHRPETTVTPEAMAERVMAAAAAAGALAQLRVRSLDWRGLRYLRATRPDVPLAWLTDAETEAERAAWWQDAPDASVDRSTPATVAAAASLGGRAAWTPVWAPDFRGLTAYQVGEAHALGLRVIPWTVNDIADMAMLLAIGVDGLCSDRPDLARTAMAAFGVKLPSPCLKPL